MNSPFNERFISKSPLRKHGKALKKLNIKIAKVNKYDAQGDKDYDYLADLQRQKKTLIASHNEVPSVDTEEQAEQRIDDSSQEFNEDPIQMKSPLHGYVDASDMVDPNPSTAHMWTKVFDTMGTAGLAIVDAKVKKKKDNDFKEWLKGAGKGIATNDAKYLEKYTEIYGAPAPTKSTS